MIELDYDGRKFSVSPGETVLEALERGGEKIPSSCRSGVCQSCLLRAECGTVPRQAQAGLKERLVNENCFLACVCRPDENLKVVSVVDAVAFRGGVEILSLDRMGLDVLAVTFKRPATLRFEAGQFMTFERGDGLSRSYSIASLPDETETFNIHVRRVPQGKMSEWFHGKAQIGDTLIASGPTGECCYTGSDKKNPVVLIGTGTGVAPLWALARQALRSDHMGDVVIFDGALSEERLYLRDEIQTQATHLPKLSYHPCVLKASEKPGLRVGDLGQIVLDEVPALRLGTFYLCGDPNLVQPLRKKLFLAGIPLKKIFADPFVSAAPAAAVASKNVSSQEPVPLDELR